MNTHISVIMLGAGKSKRFDSSELKQNYKIKNKSLIDYSRNFFSKYFKSSKRYIVINKNVKVKSLEKNEYITLGSTSRLKSLNNCLNYIYNNNLQTSLTMVHDVARPVLNLSDITKMIKSLNSKTDGVSLGYPVTNAIKELSNLNVKNNIIRDHLWSSFTPQIFKTDKLYKSIQACIANETEIDDDIEALVLNNLKCSLIMSNPMNIKITYLSDLQYIKNLL